MKIQILQGDITKLEIEAIVNPANANITMGGGLAGIILKNGGEEIKREAQKYIPVNVGKAVITGAGKLLAKYIIHAPTMEKPAEKISVENTKMAMKAILRCAGKNNIKEIAIPGLGTGVGGVSGDKAATAMFEIAKNFKAHKLKKIIFVAYDNKLYLSFKKIEFRHIFQIKNEIYLRIKARPGVVKTAIKDIMEDETIKIDVAAPPVKGKANQELVRFLACEFNVNKNNVIIISGAGEKMKLIKLINH